MEAILCKREEWLIVDLNGNQDTNNSPDPSVKSVRITSTIKNRIFIPAHVPTRCVLLAIMRLLRKGKANALGVIILTTLIKLLSTQFGDSRHRLTGDIIDLNRRRA